MSYRKGWLSIQFMRTKCKTLPENKNSSSYMQKISSTILRQPRFVWYWNLVFVQETRTDMEYQIITSSTLPCAGVKRYITDSDNLQQSYLD